MYEKNQQQENEALKDKPQIGIIHHDWRIWNIKQIRVLWLQHVTSRDMEQYIRTVTSEANPAFAVARTSLIIIIVRVDKDAFKRSCRLFKSNVFSTFFVRSWNLEDEKDHQPQAIIVKNGCLRKALSVFSANNITKTELHRSNQGKLITHDIQMNRWRGVGHVHECHLQSYPELWSCGLMLAEKMEANRKNTGNYEREITEDSCHGRKDTWKDMRLTGAKPTRIREQELQTILYLFRENQRTPERLPA